MLNFIVSQLAIGLPIVFMMVMIEGLLSVDNALVIASIAKELPDEKQEKKALFYGMWGAYIMRGALLFGAYWIIANPIFKLVGAGYLAYLTANHFASDGDDDALGGIKASFWATVAYIEFADLMFSVDNIAAAAAISTHIIWVIVGVCVGIAVMRLAAVVFIKLIDKFPVLSEIAYWLIASIAVQLVAEEVWHIDLTSVQKLGALLAIVAGGFIWEYVPGVKPVSKLVWWPLQKLLTLYAKVAGWVLFPVFWVFGKLKDFVLGLFPAASAEGTN